MVTTAPADPTAFKSIATTPENITGAPTGNAASSLHDLVKLEISAAKVGTDRPPATGRPSQRAVAIRADSRLRRHFPCPRPVSRTVAGYAASMDVLKSIMEACTYIYTALTTRSNAQNEAYTRREHHASATHPCTCGSRPAGLYSCERTPWRPSRRPSDILGPRPASESSTAMRRAATRRRRCRSAAR